MKYWLLLVLLLSACQSTAANYDIDKANKAYERYLEAQTALDDGRLIDAKALAQEAKAIFAREGTIQIQAKKRFRYNRERRKMVEIVEGRDVTYRPSNILEQVQLGQAAVVNIERLRKKQLAPPDLDVQLSLLDESGDGIIQAYEQVQFDITILNRGVGVAETLTVQLHIGFMGLSETLIVPKIQPNEKITLPVTFTADGTLHNGTMTGNVNVTELDGFNAETEVKLRARGLRQPKLKITYIAQAGDSIIPGREVRSFFEIHNLGEDPVFDVELHPLVNSTRALRLKSAQANNVRMILPNQTTLVSIHYALTDLLKTAQRVPLQLQVKSHAYTSAIYDPELRTTQMAYSHHQQWAQNKALQRESRSRLLPAQKTFVMCVQMDAHTTSENCNQLQANIFNHWVAQGHGFSAHYFGVKELLEYIKALRGVIVQQGYQQLIVYIAGKGEQDGIELFLPNTRGIAVSEMARTIHNYFPGSVQLWLEVGFSAQRANLPVEHVWPASQVSSSNALPDQVSVLFAAQPMQTNQRDPAHNQGIFTDALQTYFNSGAAQAHAAAFHQHFIEFFAQHYGPTLATQQTPFFLGADTHTATALIQE